MKYILIAAFLSGCAAQELSPQSHHCGVSRDAPIVGEHQHMGLREPVEMHDTPTRGTQMDREIYPEGYER